MKDNRLSKIESEYNAYVNEEQLDYGPLHVLGGYVPELVKTVREAHQELAELKQHLREIYKDGTGYCIACDSFYSKGSSHSPSCWLNKAIGGAE